MSYLHRTDLDPDDSELTERGPEDATDDGRDDAPRRVSPRLAEFAGRVGDWFSGVEHHNERGFADDGGREPVFRYAPGDHRTAPADGENAPVRGVRTYPFEPEAEEPDVAPQFPLAPFGYNRAAVDARLQELEHELETLRARRSEPVSISHEIERIGEQAASILVVAHDQAQHTTRQAQEQAERCIADAAANAVAITSEARQRLGRLDAETEAVWRERERLLDDCRVVSTALASLADEASARFPAAEPRDVQAGQQLPAVGDDAPTTTTPPA